MKTITEEYYANNAKKLRDMVDKVLRNLRFVDVDKDDFYSLANEVFVQVLMSYDNSQDFNGFLYSCLDKKFKTEMTRRCRLKRQADRNSVSIDTPIGDEDSGCTIGDILSTKKTVESEIFQEREEGFSKEMIKYLSKLSDLQKEVLHLISIGFNPSEILQELHINKKMYDDCYNAIHSYRNTAILM